MAVAEELKILIRAETKQAVNQLKNLKTSSINARMATEAFANKSISKIDNVAKSYALFGNNSDSLQKKSDLLQREMQKLIARGVSPLSDSFDKLSREYRDVQTEIDRTTRKQERMQKIFGGMRQVGGMLTKTVTPALIGLGVGAVRAAGDMEMLEVSINQIFGTQGKSMMDNITEFSKTTPFQLEGIGNAATKLKAFGIETDDIIQKMQNLGNASMGQSDIFDRLVDAYGKMAAKGKVTLEDLNRFTEAGVDIMGEMADQLGITKSELLDMISKGQIGFENVDRALTELTTGTGDFAGMLEAQSKSLQGMLSTMKDNLKIAFAELGIVMLPVIKEIIEKITELAKQFTDLPESTKENLLKFATFATVAGPIAGIIGNIGGAVKILIPLLSGPAGLVLAIGAVVVAMGNNIKRGREYAREMNEVAAAVDVTRANVIGGTTVLEEQERAGSSLSDALSVLQTELELTAAEAMYIARQSNAFTDELERMDAQFLVTGDSQQRMTTFMQDAITTSEAGITTITNYSDSVEDLGMSLQDIADGINAEVNTALENMATYLQLVGREEEFAGNAASYLSSMIQQAIDQGLDPELHTITELVKKYQEYATVVDDVNGVVSDSSVTHDAMAQSLYGASTSMSDFGSSGDEASTIFDELTTSMKDLVQDDAIAALAEGWAAIGYAIAGVGDEADEALKKMEQIFRQILNNLPVMAAQAGLTAISMGNVPLGLALLGVSILAGVVNAFLPDDPAELETLDLSDIGTDTIMDEILPPGTPTTMGGGTNITVNGSMITTGELVSEVSRQQNVVQRGY